MFAIGDRGDAAAAWSGRARHWQRRAQLEDVERANNPPSKSSGGGTARVALDQLGNAVVVFDLVQYVGGSGLRLSAAGVSHPAGGSWGTPVTISGANETAATVNLVATPAGTLSRAGLTALLSKLPSGQLVTAHLALQQWLLRRFTGTGCCRQ